MGTAFLRQLQQEFKGYNGQKLAKDLMAGLTVAAVALPLAPVSYTHLTLPTILLV